MRLVQPSLSSAVGEVQAPRHLGVGAPLAEQGDDVTLPVGERREPGGGAAAGRVCVAGAVHQAPGRRPRKNGVALRRHPYQRDQLVRRRGLEQVARGPGAQRPVHVLVAVEGGERDHRRRGGELDDPRSRCDPVPRRASAGP